MHNGLGRKSRAAARASCCLMFAGAGLALTQWAQATEYQVSGACGRDYEPNVILVDGDVNSPVTLTVPGIAALPGQQTLNIAFLNHLGVAQSHSETGPTLWTVLNIAAGGIKVPAPTPNEYVGEPAAQTTLYVVVVGTDGYETVVSEAEIDQGFGNDRFSSGTPRTVSCSPRCLITPQSSRGRPSSSCRQTPMAAAMRTRSAESRCATEPCSSAHLRPDFGGSAQALIAYGYDRSCGLTAFLARARAGLELFISLHHTTRFNELAR